MKSAVAYREIAPDFAEMERLSEDARFADQRISTLEARLFLTDEFDELWGREVALEKLYAERRVIGEKLLKASAYRRIKAKEG